MDDELLKYQPRIVAFLDVLGFKNKLYEFEKEAMHNEENNGMKLVSQMATDFVNVFKEVTSLMDKFDCNYYLFSDNICLTVDPYHNKSLTVDVLFTISTLFDRFSQIGYFIRGGIDFGLMLDEKSIALGTPLGNAYIMESTKAIYPRVILSERFLKFLEDSNFDEHIKFNLENFIHKNCEISFINPFYNVVKTDDKIAFFSHYKSVIQSQLEENATRENIFIKFEWLANEYNKFLDYYVNNVTYLEQEIELPKEEIEQIKALKI